MDYEDLVNEILKELYKKLKLEYCILSDKKKLAVIGSFDMKELEILETTFNIFKYKNDLKTEDFDSVLIVQTPIQMLANLALGGGNYDEEGFVLNALMEGKKIYMAENGICYKKYKNTAFKAFYNLYSEYESKIVQYGIKVITCLSEMLNDKFLQSNICVDMNITGKKLLLESDLIKNHVKNACEVIISKNCIITPLAEDYVRTHNLIIKRL